MARIAGIDLPNKHVDVALTYIYGIGRSSAREICQRAGIETEQRINDLTSGDLNEIRRLLETEFTVEGRLRTEMALNIKRLMDIGCYRGLRHRRGLPCRGQRTHTNARTHKGKRVAIAGKKKATKK